MHLLGRGARVSNSLQEKYVSVIRGTFDASMQIKATGSQDTREIV